MRVPGESLNSTGVIIRSFLELFASFLKRFGAGPTGIPQTGGSAGFISGTLWNKWTNMWFMFVNQGPRVLYLKTNTDKVKGPQTRCPWRSRSRCWFVLSFRQMDYSSGTMHYRVGSLPSILGISLAPKRFTHWSFCWPRFFKLTINLKFFPRYYQMNTNTVAEL